MVKRKNSKSVSMDWEVDRKTPSMQSGTAMMHETAAMADYTREQEPPTPTVGPAMWDLVIQDMHKKDKAGECKYGVRLQAFNGRDPLVDAYQEVLDLAVYLRQQIYEREVHLKVLNGVRP